MCSRPGIELPVRTKIFFVIDRFPQIVWTMSIFAAIALLRIVAETREDNDRAIRETTLFTVIAPTVGMPT